MATTIPTAELTVTEAVQVFANAIQGSAEWQRWSSASARCEHDPQLHAAEERLAELSDQFRVARTAGRGFSGPDLAELNRLHGEVRSSPLTLERDDAGAALVRLLRETNRRLSDALGVDFAANAAPRSGGCCG